MSKVTELPTGDYDAVRTLRHLLQEAEEGRVEHVICIVTEPCDDEEHPDCQILAACWSDQKREEILWGARWFNSWLNHRYFGRYHDE